MMADITQGRGRRLLSVGSLGTSVVGSYLWSALKGPFQSAETQQAERLATHVRNAQRVVARSQELRGAFLKLTQMLSMRRDLLPQEALDVLAVVQSQVPPMPAARVRAVVEAELGQPLETLFRRFELEAFAAASLGQVHRARLHSGEAVAVKVQYPGVADTVHQDLRNVRTLLRLIGSMAREITGRAVDLREVADELEARLGEELDYRLEAAHLARFRTLLADDRSVMLPRLVPERSTSRVLTMELLRGYPLQDILAPGVDQELKDWVAVKLFRLLWRQVFEFGALHTDPHPGNYLVTHHPRLGILDFGAVRLFEPTVRRGYLGLARALLAGDESAVVRAAVALGFVLPEEDPAPFLAVLRIVCQPVLEDREWDPAEYDVLARGWQVGEIELGQATPRVPGHHVFLLRALAGMDGYLKGFGTVRNWHRLFREVIDAVPDEEST